MTEIYAENELKTCSNCQKILPISEFGKRKVSKDGLRGQCKACVSEYHRKYRREHTVIDRELEKKDTTLHFCTSCNQRKYGYEFNISSQSPTGLKTICKSCQRQEWNSYASRFNEKNEGMS